MSLSFASAGLLLVAPQFLPRAVLVLQAMVAESFKVDLIHQKNFVPTIVTTLIPAWTVLCGALLGGGIGTLLQTRGLIRFAALRPDPKRLSPLNGFKRLFGADGLIEIGKSLIKLVLISIGGWIICRKEVGTIVNLLQQDSHLLPSALIGPAVMLAGVAIGVQALSAAIDMLITRGRFIFRHRMSRQDLKDEYKETEGNPQSKLRIKRLQRARRRPLAREVPKATAVVTNPTHYAVALTYDRMTSAAPVIVAKGADFMAHRIRTIALRHGVPIIEKPELARALFRLDVDAAIPPEHYRAVAEIIAFVWRLKGRPQA